MPCTHLELEGGLHAIVCSRGRRTRAPVCFWCGALAAYQCDAPIKGKKKTCDVWLCEHCRTNVAPNRDLCPAHMQAYRLVVLKRESEHDKSRAPGVE